MKSTKGDKDLSMDRSEETKYHPEAIKHQELLRVLNEKSRQMSNQSLTYLDYLELREEINRLEAMKCLLQKNKI